MESRGTAENMPSTAQSGTGTAQSGTGTAQSDTALSDGPVRRPGGAHCAHPSFGLRQQAGSVRHASRTKHSLRGCYSSMMTPRQKATRSLMESARFLGSG